MVSTSLLEAPFSSAIRPRLRSSSSKFSSEPSEKLDPDLRRRMWHEDSDFSADLDESDVLAWKGKQKDGSLSPNNGTRAVRGFFP